ncbi:MAG: hypothetical protein JWO28_2803 [Hyphomicrobiales bacterium]|nr:hypothetical protein [Hyphomicrobiales bacterium]
MRLQRQRRMRHVRRRPMRALQRPRPPLPPLRVRRVDLRPEPAREPAVLPPRPACGGRRVSVQHEAERAALVRRAPGSEVAALRLSAVWQRQPIQRPCRWTAAARAASSPEVFQAWEVQQPLAQRAWLLRRPSRSAPISLPAPACLRPSSRTSEVAASLSSLQACLQALPEAARRLLEDLEPVPMPWALA